MKPLYLIMPGNISPMLLKMVESALPSKPDAIIKKFDNELDLRNSRLVFALELDKAGFSIPMFEFISGIYDKDIEGLKGSEGVVLVHSSSELYTKSCASNVIFLANQLGCRFIGHPLVEATGSLKNFLTWQKTMYMPLEAICIEQCKRLGRRFAEDSPKKIVNPNLLVLHASSRKTSNTLMLWNMISDHLSCRNIKEIHVENGTVLDCIGCAFKTCMHYSEQSSCFYGGIMVEEVFPALEKADAVVWICPNYNDSLSANLIAVINRMTALYRKTGFYNKTLYSVIVSGNSGSDSLARQLVDSLNINKGFRLPPHFSIMETANDRGAINDVPDIADKAKVFAQNLMNEIKA